MAILPVGAIYSGMQHDGHWAGTPSLIIRLMEDPTCPPASSDMPDGLFHLSAWDYATANEVSLDRLLSSRTSTSPHFARVGTATLAALISSYYERHVLIVGREPARHELPDFVGRLISSGRSVQLSTTAVPITLIDGLWVSLISLPHGSIPEVAADDPRPRPDEVLACVRSRADLERVEMMFGDRRLPVWLRPSQYAVAGTYRHCMTAATKHVAWRVAPAAKVNDN